MKKEYSKTEYYYVRPRSSTIWSRILSAIMAIVAKGSGSTSGRISFAPSNNHIRMGTITLAASPKTSSSGLLTV